MLVTLPLGGQSGIGEEKMLRLSCWKTERRSGRGCVLLRRSWLIRINPFGGDYQK